MRTYTNLCHWSSQGRQTT